MFFYILNLNFWNTLYNKSATFFIFKNKIKTHLKIIILNFLTHAYDWRLSFIIGILFHPMFSYRHSPFLVFGTNHVFIFECKQLLALCWHKRKDQKSRLIPIVNGSGQISLVYFYNLLTLCEVCNKLNSRVFELLIYHS